GRAAIKPYFCVQYRVTRASFRSAPLRAVRSCWWLARSHGGRGMARSPEGRGVRMCVARIRLSKYTGPPFWPGHRPRRKTMSRIVNHGRLMFLAFAVALQLGVGAAWAQSIDPNSDATAAAGTATDTAIVTLVDQPTASYDGHVPGLAATKPGQAKKLDLGSTPVKNYRAFLAARRSDFKQWLQQNGFKGAVVHDYDLVLNAVAVRLDGRPVDPLLTAPGVASVELTQLYHPTMNLSLALINAGIGNAGGTANGGRGVKVGVIDTGIAQNHPF